jgi:hypothetical protein
MTLRALAFHRDVALDKLHEYFASDEAQAHASTTSATCPRCGVEFAIVFADRNDAGNPDYRGFLCHLIALGCNAGRHEETYVLRDR